MTSRSKASGAEIDLDEDLFDFHAAAAAGAAEDDEDLEQVFAQFEEEEAARQAAQALAEKSTPAAEKEELPASEEFAGLNPDPPPAIPRRTQPAATPALGAPSAQELEAHRSASASRPEPQAPVPAPSAAVPRPAPAPAAPATTGWKTAVWLLIAITSVNALVALVALRSAGELRHSVESVGSQVSQTASELLREGLRAAPGQDGEPEGAPNAHSHPTFELALEDIQRGEFARARRRLYALLAIVDRLDPEVREEIEARANFLLAQALHMETVQRWEVAR